MVVAVLASRFAPSSRGLQRRGGTTTTRSLREHTATSDEYRNLSDEIQQQQQHSTGHRRKRFRAMSCLTSLASDLDVISDWFFYFSTLANDRDYRRNNNNSDDEHLVPPLLLNLVLASCILGTLLWLILATDGRIVAPLLRRLGIDKLSMGLTLFLCVLLEDIPQVVLTFLVEDYYAEEDHELSNFALWNVFASLYDTLIKLAEAFDERNDLVETGAWCKDSLWAHTAKVTAVQMLPPPGNEMLISSSSSSSSNITSAEWQRQTSILLNVGGALAEQITTTTQLPTIRFLTTSLDGTIRLWSNKKRRRRRRRRNSSNTAAEQGREKCIRTFRGHRKGVTCLALLGQAKTPTEQQQQQSSSLTLGSTSFRDEDIHFLTGSQEGCVKMWELEGASCVHTFSSTTGDSVLSIATIQEGSTFVASHQSGTVRLWHAWTGDCLVAYRGHGYGGCEAVASLQDGRHFVASTCDQTLRLWDTEIKPLPQEQQQRCKEESASDDPTRQQVSAVAIHEETTPVSIFSGHSGRILCVACVEPGVAFCSGSEDQTARLWSVQGSSSSSSSSSCLRVFLGHGGGVTAVTAIDPVTILTGSEDTTVKVWDVLSGACLRTYEGHSKYVTDISMAHDDTTFASASADKTIKLWVLTTVPPEGAETDYSLDNVLDLNDRMCRGLDPM